MVEQWVKSELLAGMVIPAHPLALTAERRLDERRQRALTRYYCSAGAGGIAVGVHTTQFAIREPRVGLFAPVLRLAIETVKDFELESNRRLVKIAGVCGPSAQALKEAALAREFGYNAGLLSLAAMSEASNRELIEHCRRIAEVIPLFGFYLQPAVGGRVLDYGFWRELFEIEELVAVKIAPFNRYQTLDVIRALAMSGRDKEIALYTGNDDNIVADLLTEFRINTGGDNHAQTSMHFAGGLLGQWATWTRRAVELLEEVRQCKRSEGSGAYQLLARSAEMTEANGALFDVAHNFAGCIAGLHEVLRRQGLLAGRWCIDPNEDLSPGQLEEIDRIHKCYPRLNDDQFVAQNLDHWMRC